MKKLLWIDLEMTGLDDQKDVILEVAAVVADLEFKKLEEFHRIVFQEPAALQGMDEWCTKTHGESGLISAIPGGTPLQLVEEELLALLGRHFAPNERVVLAGNSVGNDQRFLNRYLPKLSKRLHYRIVDVSSFKEIFREKYGIKFEKKNTHRAVDDIGESMRELEAYLAYVKMDSSGQKGPPA